MRRNTRILLLLLSALIVPAVATADCDTSSFIERTIETEPGVELFVREAGSGGPAVVIPGDFLLFEHLCPLAESHRVVFYDMRNRGRSAAVEDGAKLTLEADVADLEAVRAQLGIERMHLVGYSYLGKMVVVYALEHPERVIRIVQQGPVPMDPHRTFPRQLTQPWMTEDPAFVEEVRRLRQRRKEGLHESDPAAYCELEWQFMRQGLVGDPANAASLESRCKTPNEWPTRLAFHMQHHFLGSMMSAVVTAIDIAELEHPVLTVHGTHDRNAPYGGGREWAAALPGARLLTMPGLAHAVHAEADVVSILETFFAGAWPEGAERVHSAADGQRAQLLAWDLLQAALAQLAPDGTVETGALQLVWEGEVYPRSQARTAEPPFEPAFPVTQEIALAGDGQRLELIEELHWPSFVQRFRTVVTPEDSFDVDLASGAVLPPYRRPQEVVAEVLLRLPALVLAEVAVEAPGSLRYDGVVADGARWLHSISALLRGERIDLRLDDDGGVVAIGRMTDAPMLGDSYELTRYEGEVQVDGLRLPARVSRSLPAVGVTSELELTSAVRVELEGERFARSEPQQPETQRPESQAESSAGDEPGLEQLAAGVFLLPMPGNPAYQSMVVERDDHLVLVEAPVSEEATQRLLDTIGERWPDKPVRWLVATHHHFDHAGGVPAVMAAGGTLVTTPGNVAFFRRAATAPRTLAGSGRAVERPQIEAVAADWSIPGGLPAVEVLTVAANAHAAEMLAVYLPGSRLLFQGDLARFPLDTEEPYREHAGALLALIDDRDLDIEAVAGVHGEVGDPQEFREWVEANR